MLPLVGRSAPAFARPRSSAVPQLKFSTAGSATDVPIFNGLASIFNKTHTDAQATFQEVPGSWEVFNAKLLTQVAAHDVPDVIRHAIIYRPSLIANGYVQDMLPFAQKSHFNFDAYYSGPFKGYLDKGHLWGVPCGIYTMALYYNKTMFKEAGLPMPSTDWSKGYDWGQFLDVARKLTKGRGPGKVYGFSTASDLRWWINFIWQAGGDFLSPGYGRSTLGDPAAQEALNFIHDMIFKYEVWPNPVAFNNSGNLFVSGRLAMTIDGNWQLPLFKTIKSFEWGVAPLPHHTHTYTGYYIDGWFMPKGVARPDLSWELIASFLGAQGENYVVQQSDLGIPMLKSVAEKDRSLLFNPLGTSGQQVWLDSISYGHTFPYSPIYNQLDPIIARNLDLFSLNHITPKQFAQNMSAAIDPLLAKLTPAERAI
ncbi:MAG TPA: sugar ABC transporter substrate-binding protein [Chloroflexota bacterium]